MPTKKTIIIPSIVKLNIETVEDILQHPENWGSGTKEDWEKKLAELKDLLKKVKAEMVTYARTKLIRGKAHVFITRDKIKGGDKMKEKTEQKEEMVFININEIPSKMGKRAEITNKLIELFAKIPLGKAWKINVADSAYKFGTVKIAVAKANANIKDVTLHYRCTQRKEGVDTFVYVVHGEI